MVLQAMRRRDPRQAAKVGGYEDGGVVEEGLDFGAPQANMRRKLVKSCPILLHRMAPSLPFSRVSRPRLSQLMRAACPRAPPAPITTTPFLSAPRSYFRVS